MIHEVRIGGMDEQGAAHAIEAALLAQGMLLHPLVSVLVISYAGQDVSVLGEVVRPGVYPYTLHHRLLDLISAASGLSPSAGRLVNVFHRDDARTPHPAVLDPSGIDTASDHNPELAPATQFRSAARGWFMWWAMCCARRISRRSSAGVDRGAGDLAGLGPDAERFHGQSSADREQKGGRTITTLNLKRMLHGQEPTSRCATTTFSTCLTRQPKTCGTGPWNRPFNRRLVSPFMPDWFIRRGLRAFMV